MAAQIRWDPGDSAGERTLASVVSSGRFNGWRPIPEGVGERAVGVGDGDTHVWTQRTDYGVSFRHIVAYGNENLAQEFMLWANNGGLFSLDTGDSESNSYEECKIRPGTLVEISEPDPETLDLTLTVSAINFALAPIPMRAQYA